MTDAPTPPEVPATPQPPKAAEKEWTPPASQADLDRIIADRLIRERAKFADYSDLKAKAEQFDAVQAAAMTEAEKTAKALADITAERDALKQEKQVTAWAQEVAEGAKAPALAAVLKGSTKEELKAHAEQLKALGVGVKQEDPPAPIPTIGQEPKIPGNVPIGQQIAAAEKAGDKHLVGILKAMQLGAVSAT